MNRVVVLSLLLVVAGCHCGRGRSNAARHRPTPPAHSVFETPPGTVLAPRVEQPTYRVEASPVGRQQYVVGMPTFFVIEFRGLAGSRFRRADPIRVDVRAPAGIGLRAPTYFRQEAAIDTEDYVAFEIPILPTQPGEGLVDVVLHFAVCQGETCERREEHLRVPLVIQATATSEPQP